MLEQHEQSPLLTPHQQAGDFELLAEQGRGGMAVVYRAHQQSLHRTVALKLLLPQIAADPQAVVRFQQEARHAARLSHPHIVTIYETGTLPVSQYLALPYIAMQYIEGQTLRDLIQQQGVLAPEQATAILAQISDALDYAHSFGMIHRDLKPANILLRATGQAYLSDFGLATVMGSGSGLTRTGTVIGTPEYMAPEQAEGRTNLTPATDVYALGVILYEMLSGQLPFAADTPVGMLVARLMQPPRSLHALRPDLPPLLDDVIQTALARDPAARYATAGALVAALRGVLAGQAGDAASAAAPVAIPDAPPPFTVSTAPAAHIGATTVLPQAAQLPAVASAAPVAARVTASREPSNWWLWLVLAGGLVLLAGVLRFSPTLLRLIAVVLLLGVGFLLSVWVLIRALQLRGQPGQEQQQQRTRWLGLVGAGLLLLAGVAGVPLLNRPEAAPPVVVVPPMPDAPLPVQADAEDLLRRGHAALATDDYTQAIVLFEEAAALAPGTAAIHAGLGQAYLAQAAAAADDTRRQELAQQALQSFEQAMALGAVGNADIYAGTGWAYRYLGNYREARRFFEQALATNPEHLQATIGQAWSLSDNAQPEAAAELFEDALDMLDDDESLAAAALLDGLGQAYEAMQDYDEAIEAYEEALEIDPTRSDARDAIERLEPFR